jgi:hypothetical protein
MSKPFRRGPFSEIALQAGAAVSPSLATPESLQAAVQEMRGDWR